jgi:uroporphyrinogen-III synthase
LAALTVLVTRPAAQAADWVERLRSRGVQARALPLLAIEPMADDAALRAAWDVLAEHALVMFVSPNAIERFFAARPPTRRWPAALRAGVTGPGSVRSLLDAGVPPERCVAPEQAPFDSSALWARLNREDWRGRTVLIVRGDGGRDEFAQFLREAGARVSFVQAYRRVPPVWSADEAALAHAALAAPGAHLWLISSAEAIGHLGALLPGANWRAARALASHPRIAARARNFGFGQVLEAPPTLEATLTAIASVESTAP